MTAQLITTDKLQPGDKVEHRRNGDRFTVDSVTPSSTDWRFHTPGAAFSETGMEIVGHDADGAAVYFTAAQSCQWWVIELADAHEPVPDIVKKCGPKTIPLYDCGGIAYVHCLKPAGHDGQHTP
jgi:hypothetical protein